MYSLPQGGQYCADALSQIALLVRPHQHIQHVLHRPLSSRFVQPRNSPLLSPTLPLCSHCLVCRVFFFTSTQQYSYLNNRPFAFFITPWRSRFTLLHLPLLVSILELCGDIHTNPGPHALYSFSLSLCTYNIRSLLSNDYISYLNDLIEIHHLKIIALTENG